MKAIEIILMPFVAIYVAIDNFLYAKFGIISAARQHKWDNKAHNIQAMLNYEHSRRDRYNKLHGTDWTTKRVMDEFSD